MIRSVDHDFVVFEVEPGLAPGASLARLQTALAWELNEPDSRACIDGVPCTEAQVIEAYEAILAHRAAIGCTCTTCRHDAAPDLHEGGLR